MLNRSSSSKVRSIADAIVVKDGEPFFVCPADGQIPMTGSHGFGLYHRDTRFLRGYELALCGVRPDSLAATALTGNEALLELTTPEIRLPDGRQIAEDHLALRWTRELDSSGPRLVDDLEIRNYETDAATVHVRLEFAADFEDIFEVRGLLDHEHGKDRDPVWDDDKLVFRYDGKDGVRRSLTVSFDHALSRRDGTVAELDVVVPDRGVSGFTVTIEAEEHVEPGAPPLEYRTRPAGSGERAHHAFTGAGTADEKHDPGWPVSVETDSIALGGVVERSKHDLQTLTGELDGHRYYAAGVPWFATLFGRDSLIAAYQTLAYEPGIAAETLRLLAGRQGSKDDDYTDEQPGRILHELRIGELARLHEIPHTPYYGSVDSTPLFLLVLARHAQWAGTLDLFRELRANVLRALAWIDGPGDPDGRGYVTYGSGGDQTLANQGWKDSGDAIVRSDGNLAVPPIALAEVQGYVYAAKCEIAELFERDGDAGRAATLRKQADDLRDRFEHDFWSEELGSYVLACDRDGQCDVPTSNAGQVLWSGISSPGHARRVSERLLEDDMFSGWGVRTLSSRATAFNPIGYHLGTVWPHDNGLIAEGFRRYGLSDAADQLAAAIIEASTDFPQQRLPECFAGYSRREFDVPVRYPVACHPQAWAAGAVPHLLTTILGLQPDAFARRLRVFRPVLPSFVRHVELRGLRVGDATVDLGFERTAHGTDARVEQVNGNLDVELETRS